MNTGDSFQQDSGPTLPDFVEGVLNFDELEEVLFERKVEGSLWMSLLLRYTFACLDTDDMDVLNRRPYRSARVLAHIVYRCRLGDYALTGKELRALGRCAVLLMTAPTRVRATEYQYVNAMEACILQFGIYAPEYFLEWGAREPASMLYRQPKSSTR